MTVMDSPGKVERIRKTAAEHPHIKAFVETGTACGDLPFGTHDCFDRIVTIEMDEHLYNSAVNRLQPFENVRVIFGDAADLIAPVLAGVGEPCLIWLDAHEIADDGNSSMQSELLAIEASPHRHVVLVDDARLCRGRKGWASVSQIESWAERNGYAYEGITDDVITLVG
jgi:hypothetical protein